MTTQMRAALVTLAPEWPGDKEWTGRYLFHGEEGAERYFDRYYSVLEIKPDYDSEFFSPLEKTLSRRRYPAVIQCHECDEKATHCNSGEVPFCPDHAADQAADGFHMFRLDGTPVPAEES